MNEEQVIRRAIKEEEWFHDFYLKASKEAQSVSVRQLFSKLAAEEKLHKEKLLGVDTKNLPLEKLPDPAIAQSLMLAPIDELPGLKDTFDYAIQSEMLAQHKYAMLGRTAKSSELFQWLVTEEKRHEKLLTEEKRRAGL